MTGKRAAKGTGTDWARGSAFTDTNVERMARADADNPASMGDDWADAVVGLPHSRRP